MDLVLSDPSVYIIGMRGLGFRLLKAAWPQVDPTRFVMHLGNSIMPVTRLHLPVVVGPSQMGDVPVGKAVSQVVRLVDGRGIHRVLCGDDTSTLSVVMA